MMKNAIIKTHKIVILITKFKMKINTKIKQTKTCE